MRTTLKLACLISGLAIFSGMDASSIFAQGRGAMPSTGGFGSTSGGSSYGTGSQGGSGGTSGSSSSLFNSGGLSSSLFNSGSSSTSSNSNSNSTSGSGSTGGNGAGAAGSQEAQTRIQTGQIGAATPITRGAAIERNNTGAYLINSNADVIGGQPISGGNQFANLFSQIGRSLNQGGNFNQQGGRNATRSTIRIPLKLGFAPTPVSIPRFKAGFEQRLTKMPAIAAMGPIRVTMEGSTAVLTGVVASEQDRELAEGVALLEPEVETVRNELTIQPSATGPAGLNSPSNIP